MDEVYVNYVTGEVTILIAYIKSARGTTLIVSQRDRNRKPRYKLNVVESRFGFESQSSMSGPDLFAGLSDFALSPDEDDTENAPSPPTEPLTAFRLDAPSHCDRETLFTDPAPLSTGNRQRFKPSPSPDLLTYIPYLDRVEAIEKRTRQRVEKDCATGAYLLGLLDNDDFDKALVKEFKSMINMVRHMNLMLFKGDKASGFKIRPRTLEQVEVIAVQVIHYFDRLGDKFDHAIDAVAEVKSYLPSLGPEVKLSHIRVALKVWNTQIMGYSPSITRIQCRKQTLSPSFSNLACPQQYEKDLFDGFAVFFDAQIYHAFLQLRRENRQHEICQLTKHLDAIDHSLGHVCASYDALIGATRQFAAAIHSARQRLLANKDVCRQIMHSERATKRAIADMRRESESERVTANVYKHQPPPPRQRGDSSGSEAGHGKDGAHATMDQYLEKFRARKAWSKEKSSGKSRSPTAARKARGGGHDWVSGQKR